MSVMRHWSVGNAFGQQGISTAISFLFLQKQVNRISQTISALTTKLGCWNVKRRPKIQVLLVITISLLIPLLSTYMDYYVLMEADFLSAHSKFENTDLDSLLLCKKQKFTAFSVFSYALWVASNLVEHFSCFYYQVTFPQVKTLVLRC